MTTIIANITLTPQRQLEICDDNPNLETLTQIAEADDVSMTFVDQEVIELKGTTKTVFALIDRWAPVSLRIVDFDDLD